MIRALQRIGLMLDERVSKPLSVSEKNALEAAIELIQGDAQTIRAAEIEYLKVKIKGYGYEVSIVPVYALGIGGGSVVYQANLMRLKEHIKEVYLHTVDSANGKSELEAIGNLYDKRWTR